MEVGSASMRKSVLDHALFLQSVESREGMYTKQESKKGREREREREKKKREKKRERERDLASPNPYHLSKLLAEVIRFGISLYLYLLQHEDYARNHF